MERKYKVAVGLEYSFFSFFFFQHFCSSIAKEKKINNILNQTLRFFLVCYSSLKVKNYTAI